jgi:hypothetical protein
MMQGAVAESEVSGVWASFVDGNSESAIGDFTAMINWGDGSSSAGTVTGFGGEFVVSGSHTYAATGEFTVTVTVNALDGAAGSATSFAQVGDLVAGAESTLIVSSFTSSDPGAAASQFNATVDWGDGAASSGAITERDGVFVVQGTHTYGVDSYGQPGSVYTVSTTIYGPRNEVLTTTEGISVVRPNITGVASDVMAEEGVAFANTQVAAFTDPVPASSQDQTESSMYWAGTFMKPQDHTTSECKCRKHGISFLRYCGLLG